MDISKIGIGEDPPRDVNVLIEIPQGGVPVKYELDKESGALRVDRFLNTAMFYPGNYGFIPHTLSGDGDPVDVIVVVRAGRGGRDRPRASVGALLMKDEAGERRESDRRAGRQAASLLRRRPFLQGPARDAHQSDRALFPALQGPGEGQVGFTIVSWVGTDRAEKMIVEGIRRAARAGDDVAATTSRAAPLEVTKIGDIHRFFRRPDIVDEPGSYRSEERGMGGRLCRCRDLPDSWWPVATITSSTGETTGLRYSNHPASTSLACP